MKQVFSLLFVPQEKNNHRALILQPQFFGLLIALYLINQSFLRTLTVVKPGVLGYTSEITEEKVFQETNLERQKLCLKSLHFSSVLSESATRKAQDMFKNNYWAHNSPQGKTPWDFFQEVDYQYSVAGENLAKDFYDTESVMKAWMKSPTHKANIVNDRYQEIGIGVASGVLDGVKTTLVVQHFGTPVNGVIADITEQEKNINSAKYPVANNAVKGIEDKVAINPVLLNKVIGGVMFFVIITVMVIDAYITLKSKTHRMTGSSAGHVGFLLVILLLMLFSQQGSIF